MDSDLLLKNLDFPLDIDEDVIEQLVQFIEKQFQQQDKSHAVFTFPITSVDPLILLQKNWNNDTFQYYWEKPSENFTIAAGEALQTLSAEGSDRFASINQQRKALTQDTATFTASTHAYSGIIFLGGFSFFDHIEAPLWDAFDAGALTVPKWLILKDDKYALATLAFALNNFSSEKELLEAVLHRLYDIKKQLSSPSSASSTNIQLQYQQESTIFHNGYEHWVKTVKKGQKKIREGAFKKIVLARQVTVPRNSAAPPTEMLNRLRKQYKNCSCFLMHPGQGPSFLGATPEQLASFQKNLLLTEALAGSIQRGQTISEDADLAENLSFSSKNRKEHQFVVEDIAERLAPFTKNMRHKHRPEIKKLSNVQHLYTPMRATLHDDTDILDILERLHPTPAVGGYPWKKAAPYIQELENFDRGWYAGPIGWLNAKGSGEFAVAIRSGLVGPRKAHFFAGCGIVSDSDPDTEWQETNLKLTPMISALQYD